MKFEGEFRASFKVIYVLYSEACSAVFVSWAGERLQSEVSMK